MVGAVVEVQVVEAILIADDRNAGIIQMAVDREIRNDSVDHVADRHPVGNNQYVSFGITVLADQFDQAALDA